MSIENLEVIDAISIDKDNNVVLSISDHLEWDEKNEHLVILQNKINLYLNAIESGDLYKHYPKAQDRDIVINIVSKFPPNNDGHLFLRKVKDILNSSGYNFSFENIK